METVGREAAALKRWHSVALTVYQQCIHEVEKRGKKRNRETKQNEVEVSIHPKGEMHVVSRASPIAMSEFGVGNQRRRGLHEESSEIGP